ncbi:DUF3052 domain-containing protein [bacterium]|nr:DUF3052 domain-containing protein [bacterium]
MAAGDREQLSDLARKLGLQEEQTCYFYNQPAFYFDLLDPLPENLQVQEYLEDDTLDFIHAFITSEEELKGEIPLFIKALKKDGMLWISWPKGTSLIPNTLHRELIRLYVLDLGLVDTKVASVDTDWSALKFVYRLKDR